MKVALIGNMNNNNFSIMRYLRDLGIDAYLILMSNDINGGNKHFAPENDTLEMDKWKDYIHYLKYDIQKALLFRSRKALMSDFSDFDILIGSGMVPALMNKIGRPLDIFFPYATGVEYVGTYMVRGKYKGVPIHKRLYRQYLRSLNINGLKKAKVCISAERSLTSKTFLELGVNFLVMPIPMLYNKGLRKDEKIKEKFSALISEISTLDLSLFSHVSHLKIKDKRPILEGFSMFLSRNTCRNTKLIFLEYGNDVEGTKKLITEYGLDDYVLWLPKMSRNEIMYILQFISIGIAEFEGIMWGGSGWEFMASSVPFIQYFNISNQRFEKEFGFLMPNFINTKSSEEICKHLTNYIQTPEEYSKMGRELYNWFNENGGIGLAQKWKEVIIKEYDSKVSSL